MPFKGKDQALTRHDFWRACYATMLADLPLDQVAGFFQMRPFSMGGKEYSGADLISHLWREKASVPMDWNYSGVDALEPYLVGLGVDPRAFIKRLLFRNNRATWMPGNVVLSWFYPIMDKVFRNNDPREMVFHLISIFTETYLPGHLHRCVKKQVVGDWVESFLVYATHQDFQGKIKFNFDLIAGEQIKAAPTAINLPEFEEISFLADQREPGDVLWEMPLEETDGDLRLGGKLIARKRRFLDFVSAQGLDLEDMKVPDADIHEAVEDVVCPARNRTVIHKGCVYGAPVYISRLRYHPMGQTDRGYLKHLIRDTVSEEEVFSPEILKRHIELSRRLEETLDFIYYADDDSMTVNGEHLVRGIPARILRNLLAAHTGTNRAEFQYRDFKRDTEISLGQKNSNFEVRFYRLVERLQEKCPQIKIRRLDRGKFRFECGCRLVFSEGAEARPSVG